MSECADALQKSNKKSVSISGWHVHSTKSNSIMGQREITSVEETVRTKHVPEMMFNSELRLKHAQSEVEFTFNATEALKEWMLAKNEVIKVKNSERWMQLHLERYGGKKKEEEENKREEGKEKNEETQSERTTTVLDIDELAKEGSSYDWTFTTPYRGTTTVRGEDIGGGEGGGEGVNSSELNSNTNIRWKPTEERLDMALLTRRDPIELFDEISLYESELDDHGVSSLSVKIRVTESCWFLLLRFWLCVDGVLIRSRETRLCCDLRRRRDATTAKAGAVVLRETRLREETWSQLKDRGASTDAKQYKDAEAAASVLLAGGGPVRVVNEKLEIY